MVLSVSPKDEIWFLCVCHHISDAVYLTSPPPTLENNISTNSSNSTNHQDHHANFRQIPAGCSLWMTRDSPRAARVGFVVERIALNTFLPVQLFYPINFDIIGALCPYIRDMVVGSFRCFPRPNTGINMP